MNGLDLQSLFINNQTKNHSSSNGVTNRVNNEKNNFNTAFDRAKSDNKNVSDRNKTNRTNNSSDNVQQSNKRNDEKYKQDKIRNQKSNDDVSVKQKSKKDSLEDVESTSSKSDDIEENIICILSGLMGISQEELKNWLTDKGYTALDLVEYNNFAKAINELYMDFKGENILFMEDGISNINKLFDEINHMLSGLKDNENIELMGQQTQEVDVLHINNTNISQDINANMESAVSSMTSRYSAQNEKSANQLDADVSLASLNATNGEGLNIGNVLPVHSLSSANKVVLWDNEVLNTTTKPSAEIVHDIVEQIDFKQIGMSKQLNVKLNPQELGEMNIRVIEENSNIVAQITVDNEKTKEILSAQLDILKQALEKSGLSIGNVTVDIRQDAHQSQMDREKQKSSKRIAEIINKHMEDDEIEEDTVEEIKLSQVDYVV